MAYKPSGPPGPRSLGVAHPCRVPCRPWRTSAVQLILESLQKPIPGLALSRGRAQGTIYSQNPWGSSQGCGFQRKQPSSKLPDPGNSLARATSTETLAATAHTHFHTAHYCPQPLTIPVVLSAYTMLSSQPHTGYSCQLCTRSLAPSVELIISLCSTLPPCTFAGIKVVQFWGPLVASRRL